MATLLSMHNPFQETLIAAAAYTTTQNTALRYNHESLGLLMVAAASAKGAAPSVVPTVQWSIDGGVNWLNYAAIPALASNATFTYLLYPGALAAAAGSVSTAINLPLPRLWRVSMVAGNTDTLTYSLVVQYL